MFKRPSFIFTWLIIAALPLQALAAASMLLCQPAGVGLVPPSAFVAPVETGHGHHAAVSAIAGDAADAVHSHAAHEARTAHETDADHQCGICSLCGHAVAVATTAATPDDCTAPQARIAARPPRIDSLGHPVPDKPPRA